MPLETKTGLEVSSLAMRPAANTKTSLNINFLICKMRLMLLLFQNVVFKTKYNYMYMNMLTLCRTHSTHAVVGCSNSGSGHEPSKCWKVNHTHQHGWQPGHPECWLNRGELRDGVGHIDPQKWKMSYDRNNFLPLRFFRIMWTPLYLARCEHA